jgi:predicted AlkP superfamily pyrophosphatase or phosphodiesterase
MKMRGQAVLHSLKLSLLVTLAMTLFTAAAMGGQAPKKLATRTTAHPPQPKLVVMIVVDQMRGDYVDKFRGQWTGGLKRLVEEGAWFHEAAYPYAATETCPGHATISTGAFPASHGMITNAWWDRDQQKMVTCTNDPNVKNLAYAGGNTKGGDSAARMQLPSFAEELKFQTGGDTRVVTFSLKARAAITMAGHKGDAVTWLDASTGAWVTSSPYGTVPFVEAFAKKHPVSEDYGKTWALSLPESTYLYEKQATGALAPGGWTLNFPHPLRGKDGSTSADEVFFDQWVHSPFADAYLTHLAEAAIDSLALGKARGTDYLGVSYSTLDHVGHSYGPRSWEIQDILARLDKDLGELLTHLDHKVGRGNYILALSADHGVVPVPEDMARTGADAGVLSLAELQERMEKALQPFSYTKPAIARITEGNLYFSQGVYSGLKQDTAALHAVMDAALTQPGVAAVYRAEDLSGAVSSSSQIRTALTLNYFPSRSGDLFFVPKPYWLTDGSPAGKKAAGGTGHGTPYNYDQHVPLLLLGYGIQPGEYFTAVTPADIAPTFAALCGITLATRDGRVLAEALHRSAAK